MRILDNKTVKKIQKKLVKDPNILAAYVFGSQVQGQASKKSDLDIAVVIADAEQVDYGKLYLDLSRLISGREVDLRIVTLQDTSPLFLYNLIKGNVCLYAQSEVVRVKFETLALKKFYDTANLRSIYHHYLGEAIKKGTYGYR